MFVNRMPRYDVLSAEAMVTLEGGWRLERYERPPLEAGRLADLNEYVIRRRAELGD